MFIYEPLRGTIDVALTLVAAEDQAHPDPNLLGFCPTLLSLRASILPLLYPTGETIHYALQTFSHLRYFPLKSKSYILLQKAISLNISLVITFEVKWIHY